MILALTKVLLFVLWSMVIVYVLRGALPSHPFPATPPERQRLLSISPQGWAFFTRNAREPADYFYRREGAKWVRLGYPNSSSRNFFGLKKDTRPFGVEMGSLMSQVSTDEWIACEAGLETCL